MVKRQLKQFAVYQDAAAPQTINVARQVGGIRSASRCLAVTVAATVLMTPMPPVPRVATTLALAIVQSSLNASSGLRINLGEVRVPATPILKSCSPILARRDDGWLWG